MGYVRRLGEPQRSLSLVAFNFSCPLWGLLLKAAVPGRKPHSRKALYGGGGGVGAGLESASLI